MNSSMEVGEGSKSLNLEGQASEFDVLRDCLNLANLEARDIV